MLQVVSSPSTSEFGPVLTWGTSTAAIGEASGLWTERSGPGRNEVRSNQFKRSADNEPEAAATGLLDLQWPAAFCQSPLQ